MAWRLRPSGRAHVTMTPWRDACGCDLHKPRWTGQWEPEPWPDEDDLDHPAMRWRRTCECAICQPRRRLQQTRKTTK